MEEAKSGSGNMEVAWIKEGGRETQIQGVNGDPKLSRSSMVVAMGNINQSSGNIVIFLDKIIRNNI